MEIEKNFRAFFSYGELLKIMLNNSKPNYKKYQIEVIDDLSSIFVLFFDTDISKSSFEINDDSFRSKIFNCKQQLPKIYDNIGNKFDFSIFISFDENNRNSKLIEKVIGKIESMQSSNPYNYLKTHYKMDQIIEIFKDKLFEKLNYSFIRNMHPYTKEEINTSSRLKIFLHCLIMSIKLPNDQNSTERKEEKKELSDEAIKKLINNLTLEYYFGDISWAEVIKQHREHNIRIKPNNSSRTVSDEELTTRALIGIKNNNPYLVMYCLSNIIEEKNKVIILIKIFEEINNKELMLLTFEKGMEGIVSDDARFLIYESIIEILSSKDRIKYFNIPDNQIYLSNIFKYLEDFKTSHLLKVLLSYMCQSDNLRDFIFIGFPILDEIERSHYFELICAHYE